jgi:shikimate dehydrogenase
MKTYGLVGKKLQHSFSKDYFQNKFAKQGINGCQYINIELTDISKLPEIIIHNTEYQGLNITIPYKETVIPFLDELSTISQTIGAVNTIIISRKGNMIKLKGDNTDVTGFQESLNNFIPEKISSALILGTGGASKAVAYVLKKQNISFKFISRNPQKGIPYHDVTPHLIGQSQLIINTTPLGMAPNTAALPAIPYAAITPEHYLFDLIYNPPETMFLKKGKQQGAHTKNGTEMLLIQAEASWRLWQESATDFSSKPGPCG